MTRKEAAKQMIKRNQTWEENQVLLDRHADPDAVITELQKGNEGAYKNLLPTQREKLLTSTLEFKRKMERDGRNDYEAVPAMQRDGEDAERT